MYYNSKDMLRSSVIPVLLGDNLSAHLMAAKIYLRCGMISYVCDAKMTVADYIDPFSRFFSLVSETDADIIITESAAAIILVILCFIVSPHIIMQIFQELLRQLYLVSG